jgi:hypothetical protein
MDTHITVSEIMSIKFLGLLIDNKLTWKPYGTELTIKLNTACYIMRINKPMMSRESLITIYHSYFHSILRYGILFCGNTPISKDIFKIQKRIVRINTNKNRSESCRELFKNLRILNLTSQYIISILFLFFRKGANTCMLLCLIYREMLYLYVLLKRVAETRNTVFFSFVMCT